MIFINEMVHGLVAW